MISSGRASPPGCRTTIAFTVSPHRSSGTPITATSATAGWSESTFSTSAGDTFSPPEVIMSLTPAGGKQVARLAEEPGVPRPEPAVRAERPGRLLGLAPVALEVLHRPRP